MQTNDVAVALKSWFAMLLQDLQEFFLFLYVNPMPARKMHDLTIRDKTAYPVGIFLGQCAHLDAILTDVGFRF